MRLRRLSAVVVGVVVAAVALPFASQAPPAGDDWPQYLGPRRDATYDGPPLSVDWPDDGPRIVWRRAVGAGLSGPVVADGRLVLFHRQKDREVVEALDAATGDPIWRHDYRTTYRDDFGFDEGPRAVPVVADGVVYTFGAEGQLHAVDLATGAVRWAVDTKLRFEVAKGFFGAAGSPLVTGGRVIANIGGLAGGIVAFDAASGEVLWTATSDEASYSSGMLATFGGQPTAVFLTRAGVVGLDPATGRVRFERAWRSRSQSSVNVATPIVVDDLIFVSAQYGPGAGVLRVGADGLETVWAGDESLSNHYATSVYRDGVLYGYHGRQEFGPSLRAVDFMTGKVFWDVDQFRAGSVILAGDCLVLMRESGELMLADASPEGFIARARAMLLPATVRAFPALAGGFLYVRNADTLICVDLRSSRNLRGLSRLRAR